jgi:aldose 1-epimerase
LLRWSAPVAGSPIELVDGYVDQAELDTQDGVRNGIMLPYVNRIADGRYTFADRAHDLLPGSEDRLIYHGALRRLPLTLSGVHTTESSAQIRLATPIAADLIPGYPFSLDIEIRYRVTARAIALTIQAKNTGPAVAPYAVGWHPYFRLGMASIDDLALMIPAAGIIRTRDLIPLAGAHAFSAIDRNRDLDFRQLQTIRDRQLDLCFTELARDRAGYSHTLVTNPSSGIGLRISQERGLMHLYTGDSLGREPRRSLALEPVEVMTNAFNRPDCYDRIALPPGATRSFRCAVEIISDGRHGL